MARCAERGFEERFGCCDAAGCYPDADFDRGPDCEVGCAVEKVAFVGFEGGCVWEADDGRCGTTGGDVSVDVKGKLVEDATHIAAKPITPLMMIFARRFICRSLTTKIGRIPNVQSATEFNAETTYVKLIIIDAERQVPV